jgi:cytochrome c biogenesis protein CcmG/thiol:disulfide interchange protein DsbE
MGMGVARMGRVLVEEPSWNRVTRARLALPLRLAVLLAATWLSATAQDAAEILRRAAETYREAHSFEASGALTTRVTISGVSYEVTWPLSLAQADSTLLPAGSPVPALSPLIRFGPRQWRGPAGGIVAPAVDAPGAPKGWSLFDQIDRGVEGIRELPSETIEFRGRLTACHVLEVSYKSGFPARALADRPVRYWIDQASYLILRESFGHRDSSQSQRTSQSSPQGSSQSSSQSEAAEWVFAATSVKLNEPPPAWALQALPQLAGHERTEWIERTAPEFALADLNGREVSLRALRGKAVLLSFWASWCVPCKQEMPVIERLAAEYEGLEVWGITNETADKARDWLGRNGRTLPTLVDEGREVFRDYEAEKIPVSVVVDRRGKVVSYRVGLSGEADFRAAIERALEAENENP